MSFKSSCLVGYHVHSSVGSSDGVKERRMRREREIPHGIYDYFRLRGVMLMAFALWSCKLNWILIYLLTPASLSLSTCLRKEFFRIKFLFNEFSSNGFQHFLCLFASVEGER